MPDSTSRRQFIQDSSVSAAALAIGAYAAPARAQGKRTPIRLGVIGTGGRARGKLMPSALKIPGVQITAVSDIYQGHLDAGKFIAGGNAFTTRDYHELLARKDVDAVIVASPDHWHTPMTIDAVKAGKDVYVEKPVTHSIEEGDGLIRAVRASGKKVQIGTQQRAMPQFHKAKQRIADGALGPIRKIHMQWNRNHSPYRQHAYNFKPGEVDWQRFLGNAPDQPFDPYTFRNWRWFWDFGNGILTDLMVHWLDAINMLLDLPEPDAITTIGDHYTTRGIWQTPDTIQTMFNYPERGVQIHFEGTFCNDWENAHINIMGEDATMYLDRDRYEIRPQPNRKGAYEEFSMGEGKRGFEYYGAPSSVQLHIQDWLDAIAEDRDPRATVEMGVHSAKIAHMGNKAYREGRVVTF